MILTNMDTINYVGTIIIIILYYIYVHVYTHISCAYLPMGDAYVNWTYQEFRMDGPEDNYCLHISQGEGTTGTPDRMAYHNSQPFSTYNRAGSSGNCAATFMAVLTSCMYDRCMCVYSDNW